MQSSLNACALVLQGAGVAVIDDLTARAYVSRDLQFRPITGAPHIDIMACTPPQAPPSALVCIDGHRKSSQNVSINKIRSLTK